MKSIRTPSSHQITNVKIGNVGVLLSFELLGHMLSTTIPLLHVHTCPHLHAYQLLNQMIAEAFRLNVVYYLKLTFYANYPCNYFLRS
jgi:hypothetical protein